MKTEKWQQISLAPGIEAAQIKCENAIGDKEYDDEYVCQWGGKIAHQFAFENNCEISHSRLLLRLLRDGTENIFQLPTVDMKLFNRPLFLLGNL